jgi:hypothetical protein
MATHFISFGNVTMTRKQPAPTQYRAIVGDVVKVKAGVLADHEVEGLVISASKSGLDLTVVYYLTDERGVWEWTEYMSVYALSGLVFEADAERLSMVSAFYEGNLYAEVAERLA